MAGEAGLDLSDIFKLVLLHWAGPLRGFVLGLDVERNVKIHHVKRLFGASFLLRGDLWHPGMGVQGWGRWAVQAGLSPCCAAQPGVPPGMWVSSQVLGHVFSVPTPVGCVRMHLCVQYPHVRER